MESSTSYGDIQSRTKESGDTPPKEKYWDNPMVPLPEGVEDPWEFF